MEPLVQDGWNAVVKMSVGHGGRRGVFSDKRRGV